ncbi:MAG: translesion DNA synthesis-associated protein ImuA [Betaproteobacteria bacterium]|nr:translesion DNA synthesis-associated protein ImuA [Betaproteobacteria bacterium]
MPPVAPAASSRVDRVLSSATAAQLWRADGISLGNGATLSTGFAALDALLPGAGWPLGALSELLLDAPGTWELTLLLPVLRAQAAAGKSIMFISPPLRLNAAALQWQGVPADRLIVLQPAQPHDSLWAAEQCLRAACLGAVLYWPPEDARRALRTDTLRRLQLAARSGAAPAFVFRPAGAQARPSAAPLRVALQATGPLQLAVHIVKRRGPAVPHALLLDVATVCGLRIAAPMTAAPLPTSALPAPSSPAPLSLARPVAVPPPAHARRARAAARLADHPHVMDRPLPAPVEPGGV